jgi:hypothetical protein
MDPVSARPQPAADRLPSEPGPGEVAAGTGSWGANARQIVALGYITAIAMPMIGLVIGIVILLRAGKPASKHGVWIIVVGIIASLLWVLIIASGVLKLTAQELNST